MATGAPTNNNCIADLESANATILTEILTLPLFGSDSGSCSPTTSSAVDRLQQTVSSIDLSVNIPDHPVLGVFGYSLESNAFSGKYSVAMPDVQTLIGLQLGFSIAVFIGVLFAAILYRTVIRNNNEKNEKQNSTLRKATIGSVLLLTCIFLPYTLFDAMGVQSTVVRFTICTSFVLYMFRILEAIFGFVPTGAKSSLGVYCTYFSLPFDMMFDEETFKPIMATKRDILNGQINVVKAVTCLCMLCSILSPYDYAPFGETNAGEFHERIVMRDYLDARHLGNCFAIALFFQQALALGDAAIGNFVQTVLGYKVKQSMRNPMLEATSPSKFIECSIHDTKSKSKNSNSQLQNGSCLR